jgi:zinc/manganese transport system substrate-binding protein
VPAAKRRILTSHDSLQYFASAYSITLVSVNGWTNKSEPSAAELAKLAQRIRADRVQALFLDSVTDPRAVQRIAGETGAAIGGTIYGDALSPAGGDADNYLKMLPMIARRSKAACCTTECSANMRAKPDLSLCVVRCGTRYGFLAQLRILQ